jgi:hypothetical protein
LKAENTAFAMDMSELAVIVVVGVTGGDKGWVVTKF